jgi:hypothetical protein
MNLYLRRIQAGAWMSFSLISLMGMISAAAWALETPPGDAQASFDSPRGTSEFCSLPRILDLPSTLAGGTAKYAPFHDDERASTKHICGADFYDKRESAPGALAAVVCPKLNSSNPGVMLHELPAGMSRAKYIAQECPKTKNRAGKLIAKFKQSVSCSYTPSILSYPRFARNLGSEIELPFTAYRSMDRLEHLEIATAAKDLAARVAGYDALIAQTWRVIFRDDSNPAASPRRTALYRDNYSLIFGALVPEKSGDEIYYAANGSTSGDRVANFQVTKAFQMVSSSSPVIEWGLPRSFSVETAQKLVLLREMGDLIVLDSLLNQQDRFGNLHYRPHYLRMNPGASLEWKLMKLKSATVNGRTTKVPDPEQQAEMTAQGFLAVNRMLLADNDCGVAKENRMMKAGIPFKVTHLHPDTYLAVQRLQKLAAAGRLKEYLRGDLLFQDKDVKSVEANVVKLATYFKSKCLEGKLFLDADLAQYLGAKPRVDSVDFCRAN